MRQPAPARPAPAPPNAAAKTANIALPVDTTTSSIASRLALGSAIALVAALASSGAATTSPASPRLLARAANPNPKLSSYVAAANLSAALHAPVPVHKRFNGTAYYLKPKRKIVFENVSGPLSRFKGLASTTPTYEELPSEYANANRRGQSAARLTSAKARDQEVPVKPKTAKSRRNPQRFTRCGFEWRR